MTTPQVTPAGRARRALPARATNLALALLLCLTAAVPAAEFGVDRGGGSAPNGYFMLAGEDAIQAGLTWALGDIPHKMTLYIEVDERSRLTIDIYDPGLYEPGGLPGPGQLDSSFSGTDYVGEMYFALISPMLALITDATYNADTNLTDRSSDQFYNAIVDPGTYQLYIELMDTAGADEDVSVFGLDIPGHEVYSYNYCVGHNNQAGATIADPIYLYPFINYCDGAWEDLNGDTVPEPVCGMDLVNYDMDAAIHGAEPPIMSLTTQRGFTFDPWESPHPSTNMSFWVDRVGAIAFGELDSDDQGMWRWGFTEVGNVDDVVTDDPGFPGPIDMNAFSMQVYDYGQASPFWHEWPFEPSFLIPLEDRHPRRIYLPGDGNVAPLKEHMGHSAVVVAGQDPPTEFLESTIEVTFQFTNPRAYDLTIVNGTTFVNPSPEFQNPVITDPGTNMSATINGADPKRIDITGTVPAGATETFTYTVIVTPDSPGHKFVTGDGSGFTGGGGRQTRVQYNTPVSLIYGDDVFGPICELWFDALDAICTIFPDVQVSQNPVCQGEMVTFDATGTAEVFCPPPGVIEYQWSVDGNVVLPFPAVDVVNAPAGQSAVITMEARCSTEPATCIDSVDVPLTVWPAPPPAIDPDPPLMCPGNTVTLTLTNPGDYDTYTWSTAPANEPGDGLIDVPSVDAQTIGAVYTIDATTPDGCAVQGSVTVEERILPPPQLDGPGVICPGTPERIEVVGTYDRCEWSTNPADADGDNSMECWVETDDGNVEYTVTVYDAEGCSSQTTVTTVLAADNEPPAVGDSLRVAKQVPTDLVLTWTDLGQDMAEYWIPNLDADSTGDGLADTVPDDADVRGAPYFVAAGGDQTYTEADGLIRSSYLVFYKVRAVSECYLRPGPP